MRGRRGGLLTIDAPDGGSGEPLTFEHLDAAEARFLYEEIFVARSYAQRFAKPLKSNATIVDIGANIGVFALWALRGGLSDEASERSVGALLAIEPIARTHAVLRRNLAPWPCADALRVAVGQRNEIEPCLFEFYPDQPGESTRNAAERAAQRRRLKNSALARRARAAELASAGAAAHAEPGAESPEEPAAEREHCTVRSLHWILSRWEPLHGGSLPSTAASPTRRALKRQRRDRTDVAALPRIDLLKIDVEGDELACLLGLDRVDDSSDDSSDGDGESASASSGGNGGSGGVPRRRAVEWTWWQRIERIVVEVRASRLPLHPFHANSSHIRLAPLPSMVPFVHTRCTTWTGASPLSSPCSARVDFATCGQTRRRAARAAAAQRQRAPRSRPLAFVTGVRRLKRRGASRTFLSFRQSSHSTRFPRGVSTEY